VAFALLNRILGARRVYGLHIDNGLMRQDESRLVMKALRRAGFANLHVTDASRGFLDALAGVTGPEAKRRIIGDYFLEVKSRETQRLGLDDRHWLLGQGTIYPDTIETGGTQHADTIKTHHNRVDAVQKLMARGLVLEPLSHLYKDEVRALGRTLKLSSALLERHPFPGPGLGVRLLCSNGKTRVPGRAVLNRRIAVLVQPFQYQGQVVPVRSVGVQGDSRTFTHPVMLQGGRRDWDRLEKVSTRLTNQVHAVNRVVYLLHPRCVAAVTERPAYMTDKRLDLLRAADRLVMDVLHRYRLTETVWQFPVVLVPLSTDGKRDSVVLRPVLSREAMTARFAPLPWKVVDEMVRGIKKLDGIDLVLFDVTHKPPATIEWE
jgi:GMP synthase (glutamine-hydrolysing)